MSASSISARKGLGRKATMLVLGALVACLGVFAFASPAKADPFNMSLDNGKINLGFAFKNATILPAPDELDGNPLPNLWGMGTNTPDIKISGENNGGTLSVAQGDFQPPIMIVPNPLDGSPVPITLRAQEDLTGSFDAATGDLTLNGGMEARVLVNLGSMDVNSYCAVPLTGLSLSTANNADFGPSPFTSGIDGNGAISGTFSITADSIPTGPDVTPADCATVNQVSKGLGSLWVSHGITTPAEPLVCPDGTSGTYPDCVPDPPEPCPAGTTGTPPDCKPDVIKRANISRVVIAPKKAKIRAGKAVKLRVRVTNRGNAAGRATVVIKVNNRQVKAPKRFAVRVPAGKTVNKVITVRATKKAKGRAVVRATANKKTGKAVLSVVKAKKKRR